jgi:two-component system, cell cycle response regulator
MEILVAEDSAVYRRVIGSYLRDWGFDLKIASDGTEAWKILQEHGSPKLTLLDWVLPGVNGTELCRRIRARSAGDGYVYTVVLTAKNERKDMLQAMAAGADDYLMKPFDEAELRARLFAGKRILELQEQLVSARESLQFAATHDALTGVWNRMAVIDFLTKEMARSKRENTPVAVLLADIDHFKHINDTLGHLEGDSVLKEVAKRMSSDLRIYDEFGRYGEEEFLIIMPGCDLPSARRRGEEIRKRVCTFPVRTRTGEALVTISMGVVARTFAADLDPEEVLGWADQALYSAKHKGRNRVEDATIAVPSALEGWAMGSSHHLLLKRARFIGEDLLSRFPPPIECRR